MIFADYGKVFSSSMKGMTKMILLPYTTVWLEYMKGESSIFTDLAFSGVENDNFLAISVYSALDYGYWVF
jgi:hypothetical protein